MTATTTSSARRSLAASTESLSGRYATGDDESRQRCHESSASIRFLERVEPFLCTPRSDHSIADGLPRPLGEPDDGIRNCEVRHRECHRFESDVLEAGIDESPPKLPADRSV